MNLHSRNRSLESYVRRKRSRVVRGGAVGKVPGIRRIHGNSLAAYSTARTVLRGRGGGNAALLPDPPVA
jgi:hypothetical protein